MERVRSIRRRRRYDQSLAKKCKEICRNFVAFMFSNVGIIGLVVGYATVGSFIFQYIEKGQGEAKRNLTMTKVLDLRDLTAEEVWNVLMHVNPLKNNFDDIDEVRWKENVTSIFIAYQKRIVDFIKDGYEGPEGSNYAKWNFPESFLYSLTVITTIGYGNIYPITLQGKIVTIVYAIVGMPLFLLYLSNIGDIMARSFKWIYAKICLCKCCPGLSKKRAERERQKQEGMSMSYLGGSEEMWGEGEGSLPEVFPDTSEEADDDDSEGITEVTDISYDAQLISVPVTVSLSIMVGYICSGAYLFSEYEGWNFLDGSYFCFISLSTIGFGDLVPGAKIVSGDGDEQSYLRFIFCSMYLMLGMALIAMCFNLMQEEVINKIRSTIRSIKYMLRCNR